MPTTLNNEDLKTMVSCLKALVKHGFDHDFKVNDKGLRDLQTDKIYNPPDVKIQNYFRFEGSSDPADMSILYAIETSDGARGTLVDAYGPYGDTRVAAFMKEVEGITKIAGEALVQH